MSLRAAVKRFENDPDHLKYRKQAEEERSRRLKDFEELKAVRSELSQWKSRAVTAEEKLERRDRKIEHIEDQLKSQKKRVSEQMEIIRQRDRQIGELKKEKEELLQPFRDALIEMRESHESSEDSDVTCSGNQPENNNPETIPECIPEEVMSLMKEIVDLRGNLKAKEAQLRNNNGNCSMSSSQCPNNKTPNNREKSNRKPGAQPGHEGHGRKKLEPDITVTLGVPEEVLKDPDLYYKTGEKIIKQIHSVRLIVEVIQYEAIVYRHRSTHKRVWARFPKGIVNDITYDASVKALACMLHSHGNMSYEKVQEVISELTDGKLKPSTGFLAGLEREFSDKTSLDRQHIWDRMLRYPYMHVDGTTIYVNGKKRTILVCTSPAGTLCFYSESKGHKAVRKSVLKDFQGTVISDGESTFFNYGKCIRDALSTNCVI